MRKLSLVFERTSILSYSRFQSNARQDEGVILLLTRSCEFFLFCFIFSLEEKKNRPCFRKLSTVFPNIPFAECGRYDFTFVFNIARKQIIGGDCAALYAY